MREHDEPWKMVRRVPPPREIRPRPVPRASARLYAVAASLVAISLLTWAIYLNSRIRDLRSPQTNLVLYTLFPEGEVSRGGFDRETLLRAAEPVLLVLSSLEEPKAFPSYEVLIEDADGKTVGRLAGVKRGPDGAITLSLPTSLPEGDYRVKVVGIERGRSERLESYRFSVRPRGP